MSKQQNIFAPFKPFTLGEAASITGIPFGSLDELIRTGLLPIRTGDDGETRGLDITGVFAAFVAAKWQAEGAGADRIVALVQFVVERGYESLMREVAEGRSFPTPEQDMMVPVSPRNRLMNKLNFRVLNGAFRRELLRAFPEQKSVVNPGFKAEDTN